MDLGQSRVFRHLICGVIIALAVFLSSESRAEFRSASGEKSQRLSESIHQDFEELDNLIERLKDRISSSQIQMNAPDTATSPSGQDAVVQLARPARLPTALPCFGDVFQPRSHAQVDELLTQAETVIEASSGRLEALAVLFKMQADGPCDGAMTAVLQSAEQQLAAVPRPELLELHFYLGSCWVDRSELDSRGRSIGIDAMHDKTRELLEGHQEQARRLLRDKNRCGM